MKIELPVKKTRGGNIGFIVEDIKQHFGHAKASKPDRHICSPILTDPKIAAFSAGCERHIWRINSALPSGAQRRGHLPQEHMGQPGFDEMGGDGRWAPRRGLLELRSNQRSGCICKQEEADAATLTALNVDMNTRWPVKTQKPPMLVRSYWESKEKSNELETLETVP